VARKYLPHKNTKLHIEESDLSEKKNTNLNTLIYDLESDYPLPMKLATSPHSFLLFPHLNNPASSLRYEQEIRT